MVLIKRKCMYARLRGRVKFSMLLPGRKYLLPCKGRALKTHFGPLFSAVNELLEVFRKVAGVGHITECVFSEKAGVSLLSRGAALLSPAVQI